MTRIVVAPVSQELEPPAIPGRFKGFSQESSAGHCGLHRTYSSGIERGVRKPTVVILDKIAKGLKVPAGQLLDEPSLRPRKG